MTFLSEFRGATKANLVKAFHMSRGAATTALEHLENRGLVKGVGEHLYVTRRGLDMLAARDRVTVGRLVEVTYKDPEGEDAIRERRHDSAVAEVAAAFRGAGVPAVAGWRWVVSWNSGQLVPDLWVQLLAPGREEGIWVAVEVEFSAKAEKRIEAKFRSYRLAPIGLNRTFPLLVITGEALPAKRFDDLAGNLPVLTTTLQEFLSGVWEGPESVWRRKGRPVGLSDIARVHRGHLCQQTGRLLDYQKPSPEVWAKLIREESICSDYLMDGVNEETPDIGPELQAEADRALHAAREGPSANKPVSAPMPPTPPPAPVPKAADAQDEARRRSELLGWINSLVASVDEAAGSRLESGALSDAEHLCLWRMRTMITYGINQHYRATKQEMEDTLQRCITMEEKHLQALRSGKLLKRLTLPQVQTDPRRAFRNLLKDSSKKSKEAACEKFDDWADIVDRDVQAARKARTL